MPRPSDAPTNAYKKELGSWASATGLALGTGEPVVHIYNTGNTTCTVEIETRVATSGSAEVETQRIALDPGEDVRREIAKRLPMPFLQTPVKVTNVTQRDQANNQEPRIEMCTWGGLGPFV